MQRHDVEAIKEIVANRPALAQFVEITMGGGDQPEVGGAVHLTAKSTHVALLQGAQQTDLHGMRNFADLVEEERSAIGLFQVAAALPIGTGKCPLFVTEEFGFEEAFRNRSTVDLDQFAIGAWAVAVQQLGHQLLAGTALALYQDGGAGIGHALGGGQEAAHAGADGNDIAGTARTELAIFPFQRLETKEAVEFEQEQFNPERFGQVIVGAGLHRPHCRLDGSLPGHQQHRTLGLTLGQKFKEGVPIEIGEAYIEKGNCETAMLDDIDSLLPIFGDTDKVALVEKSLNQHFAVQRVVLDQQQIIFHRIRAPLGNSGTG